MKKYIILLLLSVATFAQTNPTSFNKIKVMNSTKDNTVTRVMVQDSITKELKWVLKSSIAIPHLQANIASKTVWNNGQSNITTNTSFGQLALIANTTGSTISAYGFGSLSNNTTGESNSGFGGLALGYNQAGSFNTASGYQAGQLYGVSTTNTNPNNSTYLGAKTRSSAANMTNETVIGYDAIGKGNNTIQLGNASVTDLYTSAKITASPATLSTHLVTKGQLDAKATNISIGNKNANTFDIVSSSGTGATAPSATITEAGLMTASDKVKINNLGSNAYTSTVIPTNTNQLINGSDYANNSDVVHKIGNEAISGIKTFNSISFSKSIYTEVDSGNLNFNNYNTGGVLVTINLNGTIKANPATLSTQVPTWGQTTVSPALTGTPTAPTATLGTNTTQLATTAFVLANGATSGTYTPSTSSLVNITTAANYNAKWIRVGNIITVTIALYITPTAVGNTSIRYTLPFTATSWQNEGVLTGTIADYTTKTISPVAGKMLSSKDKVEIFFTATSTNALEGAIIITYVL